MINYVALVWNPADQAQKHSVDTLKLKIRSRLGDWKIVLEESGILVAVPSTPGNGIGAVYKLAQERGVVLGKIFERSYVDSGRSHEGPPRQVSLDESVSTKMVVDGGDTLRGSFWGGYVAFLTDRRSGRHWVLRDPTGAVPCQTLNIRGVSVYFASLEHLERIQATSFRVNRHFMVGILVSVTSHSSETGYEGVSTVLPGERIEHGGGGVRRQFYWNIIETANSASAIGPEDARARTRTVVRSCIHAWSSCFKSLTLQLSGGLDSTIIAACLADAPTRPRVTCVNFFADRETSDERAFARDVATRCGFELLEIPDADHRTVNHDHRDERLIVPMVSQPPSNAWSEAWGLLASKGIEGHIRGDGGDELFYRGGYFPDSVDIAFRHGLTPALWKVAWNDAVIGRTTVWEVLRTAVRHGLLKRPGHWSSFNKLHPNWKFFTEEARDEACRDRSFGHPLFRQTGDCSPGKIGQARSLLKYINRFYSKEAESQVPTFAPLLSQPHMEFSLQTPLHILRAGGRDRAMARSAFEAEIPQKILNRRYKGLSAWAARDWVADDAAGVREMLLDGYLVRERIVDRHALEAFLATRTSLRLSSSTPLIVFVSIEAWVRNSMARGELAA